MSEDGKSGGQFQGPGAHPFIMIRISGTNRYAGLFFLCSSSMQLELKPSTRGTDWSNLIYKSLGHGNLEFYLFFGPDFNDVIKQYQEVIGRP
jgi:alpha-glucosidase (family GH31 glycosyl hydrolase)